GLEKNGGSQPPWSLRRIENGKSLAFPDCRGLLPHHDRAITQVPSLGAAERQVGSRERVRSSLGLPRGVPKPVDVTKARNDLVPRGWTMGRQTLDQPISESFCQRRSKIRQFRRLKIRQIGEGTSLRSSGPPDEPESGGGGRRRIPVRAPRAASATARCAAASDSCSRESWRGGSGARVDRSTPRP